MQVATPGGAGLPAFYAPMLAPFTELDVISLADFSARLPPGTPSEATNERVAVQCFQKVRHLPCKLLFICIPLRPFGTAIAHLRAEPPLTTHMEGVALTISAYQRQSHV